MANNSVLASAVRNVPHIKAYDDLARERLAAMPLEQLLIYLVDVVEESALYFLADQFDVLGYKGWILADTEEKKRALIKQAIELHRFKGTPWSVKEAIKRFGYEGVTIDESLDDNLNYYNGSRLYDGSHIYGGDFHWAYFRVLIDISSVTTDILDLNSNTLIQLIYEYKNVRSWLYDLTFTLALSDDVPPSEELAMDVEFTLVDDVSANYFYNGNNNYDGSIQYDWDFLFIDIINVADENFDYFFDFDIQ